MGWGSFFNEHWKAAANERPRRVAAKKKTFELGIKMGVAPRAEIQSADEMKEYLDMGVRHFSLGTDISILYSFWKNEGEKVLRAMQGE